MNRFFCYLLLLHTVWSVLQPCADEWLCSVTENHADAEQQEKDACSPFCGCACCGVPVIPQEFVAFEVAINTPIKSPFIYFETVGDNFNPTFWQPPKV